MIQADGRTVRPEEAKSRFWHFANAPTKKGLVRPVGWIGRSSYCKWTVFVVTYEKTHTCVVHVCATLQMWENCVIIWSTLFANGMNCNTLLKNDVSLCSMALAMWSLSKGSAYSTERRNTWQCQKQANFCEPTVQIQGICVVFDYRLCFKVSHSIGNLEMVKWKITYI